MVYLLGENLVEGNQEEVLEKGIPAVFIISPEECMPILKRLKMSFRGTPNLENVYYNKLETHRDYLFSTLAIPNKADITGNRFRMKLFINQNAVVIVKNRDDASRIIPAIQSENLVQGENKVRFLYNFIVEIIQQDAIYLEKYEKQIMKLEDAQDELSLSEFQQKLHPIRREIQTMRSYYEQMCDVCEELEEDKNGFFSSEYIKYFGVLLGRFNRLQSRCADLLEYSREVKEEYQAQSDGRQNSNMAFLTVVSTIFLPLTLITGWYGMNFENMPELRSGYPAVIILSLVVILICIYIFKKKKMF